MSIKCLLNGVEVNYPCSPVCALFGDCVVAFEAQKKENVRTNADRIRAMSDEELAEFLESTHSQMAIKLGGEYIVREKEYIGIWLKQPVEE